MEKYCNTNPPHRLTTDKKTTVLHTFGQIRLWRASDTHQPLGAMA